MGCLDTKAGKDYTNRRKVQEVKIYVLKAYSMGARIQHHRGGTAYSLQGYYDSVRCFPLHNHFRLYHHPFQHHVCFAICGAIIGHPWSMSATLMVAMCLEHRILGVCPEALEARSNKALSRLFARMARLKRASDSCTGLCVRMRPCSKADTMVSNGAPGCIGCAAIIA